MNSHVHLALARLVLIVAVVFILWMYVIWRAFGQWPSIAFGVAVIVWALVVICRETRVRAKKREALLTQLKCASSEGRSGDFNEAALSLLQLDTNLPRVQLEVELNKHSRDVKAVLENAFGNTEEIVTSGKIPTAQEIENQIHFF